MQHGFDDLAEKSCAKFYAPKMGRPSLAPGVYFRLLLIGYFEGLDSERGIAWRTADSLALRGFLGLVLTEAPPDHSTISRTRRLIDVETHQAVFTWVLQRVAEAGLLQGKTGAMRRTHLRGRTNILKRLLIHVGALNLGIVMRAAFGFGTPRALQGRIPALVAALN